MVCFPEALVSLSGNYMQVAEASTPLSGSGPGPLLPSGGLAGWKCQPPHSKTLSGEGLNLLK